MSQYIETMDGDGRICPYCGYNYQVESENYSNYVRIEECDECGKKFYSYDSFSVTHYAIPNCELNGLEHSYKDGSYCLICGKYKGNNL